MKIHKFTVSSASFTIPNVANNYAQHTRRRNDAMEYNSSARVMLQLLTQHQPTNCTTQSSWYSVSQQLKHTITGLSFPTLTT